MKHLVEVLEWSSEEENARRFRKRFRIRPAWPTRRGVMRHRRAPSAPCSTWREGTPASHARKFGVPTGDPQMAVDHAVPSSPSAPQICRSACNTASTWFSRTLTATNGFVWHLRVPRRPHGRPRKCGSTTNSARCNPPSASTDVRCTATSFACVKQRRKGHVEEEGISKKKK